jgi:hypothetical protein
MFITTRCGANGSSSQASSTLKSMLRTNEPHSIFHLENLARDPLIQYVKASIHPSHEKELADLLRFQRGTKGQPIYDHFIKNWQKDSLCDNGKLLAGEWRVPGPDTDFIPNKWIPPPRNNDIDPSMFDGESASF